MKIKIIIFYGFYVSIYMHVKKIFSLEVVNFYRGKQLTVASTVAKFAFFIARGTKSFLRDGCIRKEPS